MEQKYGEASMLRSLQFQSSQQVLSRPKPYKNTCLYQAADQPPAKRTKREDPVKKFRCDHKGCGKAFSKSDHLKTHKRTHTGEKPYQCQSCWKGFSDLANLKRHLRIHTGEKPFKCDQPGCEKRFSVSSNLKQHKRTHTGERPYICEVCFKTFSHVSSRRKHMVAHEDVVVKQVVVKTEMLCPEDLSGTHSSPKQQYSSNLPFQPALYAEITYPSTYPAPTTFYPHFTVDENPVTVTSRYCTSPYTPYTSYTPELYTTSAQFMTPCLQTTGMPTYTPDTSPDSCSYSPASSSSLYQIDSSPPPSTFHIEHAFDISPPSSIETSTSLEDLYSSFFNTSPLAVVTTPEGYGPVEEVVIKQEPRDEAEQMIIEKIKEDLIRSILNMG